MRSTAELDYAQLLSVQAVLYREAQLLDDRDFVQWLSLFTDDAEYVLPIREGSAREPAIIRDSRAGLDERVYRLMHTLAHAQNPPSQTQHDVTNVRVEAAHDAELVVSCNAAVHEFREGEAFHVGLGVVRTFYARCQYRLVRREGGELLIRQKRCLLLDRAFPIYNLTFVF